MLSVAVSVALSTRKNESYKTSFEVEKVGLGLVTVLEINH